jgi:hypothetical protein
MSSTEFHHYTRDEFLGEFFPDPADKATITAGMEQLRAEQRAWRLAEMRRRLGACPRQPAAGLLPRTGRVWDDARRPPPSAMEARDRMGGCR